MSDHRADLFLLNRLYALQADVATLRREFEALPDRLPGIPVICRAGIALVDRGLTAAIEDVRTRFGSDPGLATAIAHEHAFDDLRDLRAPVPPGPPSHTRFVVGVCACGAVEVFPRLNYNLTTAEFREGFEREMADRGRFWGQTERGDLEDGTPPDRRPQDEPSSGAGGSG